MKIKNNDIINYAEKIRNAFSNTKKDFPVKVIFYIQKNQNLLYKLADEIETVRVSILKQYADLSEDGEYYVFREDTKTIATEKLRDLSELQQEVNISMITLEDLKDISLTKDEIDAIMFMIQDE